MPKTGSQSTGRSVLDICLREGADLLIKGAYTNSRLQTADFRRRHRPYFGQRHLAGALCPLNAAAVGSAGDRRESRPRNGAKRDQAGQAVIKPIDILPEGHIEAIYEASLKLLEEIGIEFMGENGAVGADVLRVRMSTRRKGSCASTAGWCSMRWAAPRRTSC